MAEQFKTFLPADLVDGLGHVLHNMEAEGFFVDAKRPSWVGFLPGLPSSGGSIHAVPALIPADPHGPACAEHGGALANSSMIKRSTSNVTRPLASAQGTLTGSTP